MTEPSVAPGTLYVVATPIGCLSDITERAVSVLESVDKVAAEDTRHSGQLFQHLGVQARMVSLHDHNESQRLVSIVDDLKDGRSYALVSDAGTPLVSDPGYKLVSAVHDAGLPVVPVPGPSAVITALSVAGLPTDRFFFEGFLPAKSAARVSRLKGLKHELATLVFYESSHRITDSLRDMRDVFGAERRVCMARELTKRFETIRRLPLGELLLWVESDPDQTRGEFVLIVEGASARQEGQGAELEAILDAFRDLVPPAKLAKAAAKLTGVNKSEVYRMLVEE